MPSHRCRWGYYSTVHYVIKIIQIRCKYNIFVIKKKLCINELKDMIKELTKCVLRVFKDERILE